MKINYQFKAYMTIINIHTLMHMLIQKKIFFLLNVNFTV